MTTKDFTRYDIDFIQENEKISRVAKTNLPLEVFKYLIENDLMTNEYFSFFNKNNFGRTWLSNKGDLIINNPNNKIRYKEFIVKNQTYYVSSQWQIDTITKFINYINSHFSKFIKIEKSL